MEFVNNKLQEFERFIQNKTVAIIGLESSNLPLLDYFCDKGANVTVFDNRTIDEIDKTILDKITDRCIRFSFGNHCLINLVGYEIVFRGPHCRPDLPEIKAEQLRGAVIISEIEMILEMAPCKIIGVTGSTGAELTAKLIYSILKEAGKKCYLGGNIGEPLFTELKNISKDCIIVLQANAMQLSEVQSSPQIAVITNISTNKTNIINENVFENIGNIENTNFPYTSISDSDNFSMYETLSNFEKIYKYQDKIDVVIMDYDNDFKKQLISEIPGKVRYYSAKSKIDNGVVYDNGVIKNCVDGVRRHILTIDDAISIEGIDNYKNICAAISATSGIVDPSLQARAIIKYQ